MFSHKKADLLDLKLTTATRNLWTPDASALEEHAFHLLFAYDRFQQGFDDHTKLVNDHCVYAGEGFTDELFVMQKSRVGKDTYPIIQRKDNYTLTPPKRVKGQLFYLLQEEFRNLDTVRKNGVEFRRELLSITIPYTNLYKLPSLQQGGRHKAEYLAVFGTEHPSIPINKVTTKQAYCYVAVDEYWDDLVSPYQWGNVTSYISHREGIGSYYHFTKRELFDHD